LGRFDVVARNMRENFEQTKNHIGVTVDAEVYDKVHRLTEAGLERQRPLIEARAARGLPRDIHGDLHLDHVYWFPDKSAPDDWAIIDCIEFNERFRYADPMSDVAFLAMDLSFHGRRDLSQAWVEAYAGASGDREGRALLPLCTAYRAVVRAKVEGMELAEQEIPDNERCLARERAQAHWCLALGELEEPGRRPGLVLIAGLPGAGKSTLAQALAHAANFEVLRSDVIRKELAGLLPEQSGRAVFGSEIYSGDWTERTYREIEKCAAGLIAQGKRVLVDASFRSDLRRRQFFELAQRLGATALMLECRADPTVVRKRLQERQGDASDADWAVYQLAAGEWETPSQPVKRRHHVLDTGSAPAMALQEALEKLRQAGL
jgi:predicted kinase